MSFKFNPTNGQLDLVNPTTAAGAVSIPEYTNTDPASPVAGDMWVKYTTVTGGGAPIGLLLALTSPGSGSALYELSYFTDESTTIRVEMS